MLALLPKLLDALIAIPKIGDMVMGVVSSIVQWWLNKQTANTLGLIADAAAQGARAQTDQDRYKAAAAWQKALSQPRIIP